MAYYCMRRNRAVCAVMGTARFATRVVRRD
jgi:hypothetical protein